MLEILMVMVIVAILFGIGTAGLMRLRSTLNAEQGLNQLSSLLKSEKNKAKNNVLDEVKLRTVPGEIFKNISTYMLGTRITFSNLTVNGLTEGVIDKYLCWRDIDSPWGDLSGTPPSNCIFIEQIKTVGGIIFDFDIDPPYLPCGYVLFENLTEQVVLNTIGDCKVNINTETFNNPSFRELVFYKTLGYYDIITPL